MASGEKFSCEISEQLLMANMKEAYPSSNKINYISQMLNHNDQCTGLAYMKQILSHLALQGWYNIDSGTDFN
jgi:hypothetical protein